MATVCHYGAPDLFITFSCNPKCEAITKSLLPGQSSDDRPDIVNRVYMMQLKEMIKDIVENKVFGKVVSYFVVVEFQKRGLPHTHQSYTLAEEDKPRTPEDIDKIVTAEIPDPETQPLLHELVKTHMVHGPCGIDNPDAPCMKMDNGVLKCSKGYPKPFQETTTIDEFGRVQYRRRNNGRKVKVYCGDRKKNFNLSNQWIVPYNPALLLKYQAYINIEIVHGAESHLKYMFKYFTKGPDRCLVQMKDGSPVTDELNNYQDSRYIGATEGCWRIQEFPLRFRYPPVEMLAIHLEDQQNVLFKDGELTKEELQEVLNQNQTSQLTKFFKLNQENQKANAYRYDQILQHFRWDKTKKEFIERKNKIKRIPINDGELDDPKSDQIGRMPIISLNPHTKELFFSEDFTPSCAWTKEL